MKSNEELWTTKDSDGVEYTMPLAMAGSSMFMNGYIIPYFDRRYAEAIRKTYPQYNKETI